MKAQLGIHIGPRKFYLLKARLEKLCGQAGYADLEALAADLESGQARAVEALAVHLTTNHTFFFRESEHLRLLVERLEPKKNTRLRLWSAAGSSGEEGCSMAMTLLEAGFHDFLVLVSDVSTKVLRLAARGVYSVSQTDKVPAVLRQKYFEAAGPGLVRAVRAVRDRLRFRSVNLMIPAQVDEPLDVIFCRNLLIYFDDAEADVVLRHLADALKPGGLLFLGQTEGFRRPPGAFRSVAGAVYQKFTG